MTVEERLQQMLGAKDIQIAQLATQLEAMTIKADELARRNAELEPLKDPPKAD